MATFEWPTFYTSYPPFFTLQRVLETREKQTTLWRRLILSYCEHHRKFTLDVSEMLNSELCHNEELGRHLSEEALRWFLDDLVGDGHAHWADDGHRTVHILWKTAEEWGALLYAWAQETGETICTLYELHSGDSTENEAFHGADEDVLILAIEALAAQGKTQTFQDGDDLGVKFHLTQ